MKLAVPSSGYLNVCPGAAVSVPPSDATYFLLANSAVCVVIKIPTSSPLLQTSLEALVCRPSMRELKVTLLLSNHSLLSSLLVHPVKTRADNAPIINKLLTLIMICF